MAMRLERGDGADARRALTMNLGDEQLLELGQRLQAKAHVGREPREAVSRGAGRPPWRRGTTRATDEPTGPLRWP